PIVFHKDEKGVQNLDIFDTREQARKAHDVYKEQLKLAKSKLKPIPDDSTLQTAENAKMLSEKNRLALESTKREAERLRIEQLEKQRLVEKEKEVSRLSQAELAKRKKLAEAASAQGMQLYQASNFVEAEKKFREAAELNPNDKRFYYYYGI